MKKRSSANPSLVRTLCRKAIPLLGAVLLPGLALGAGPDRGASEVGSRVPGEVGVGVGKVLTRSFGDGAGVLAVRVGEDFQPAGLEVEPRPEVKLARSGGTLTAVAARPAWVEDLIAARMGGGGLAAGMLGSASAALPEGASGRVRLVAAVALEEAGSAVEVRLVDGAGRVVKTLEASASQPVRWRADLGEVASARLAGDSRLEIAVLRGRASGTLAATPRSRRGGYVRPIHAKSGGGTAYFNYSINWAGTGDLYYYVTGGPANTCGDLTTYRNGSWQVTSGWLCTDASGNATKGPWSWSSTPSDQTDDPVYIAWPDGTQTTSNTHIWDKTCATTSISNASPYNFSGSASDTQWGAGFSSSWTSATCTFDDSNGHYWGPGLSGYTSSSPISVNATVSGMPGFSVTWSCPTPPFNAQTGVANHWTACVTDGGCGTCDEVYFSVIQ